MENQRNGLEYAASTFCFVSLFNSSTLRAMSGSVDEPDSELQKDEEEGEGSLLCDSEEMDLLGEIFDTLSSRSSHECGLLYGTRSLDLFGPDSHDYIMKVRSGLSTHLTHTHKCDFFRTTGVTLYYW